MKTKKTGFIVLCLILTASLFFTGCLLFDAVYKQSAREDLVKDIKGSPEDMVVVYGASGFTRGLWFQANTKKAPGHAYFYMENDCAVSMPLVPGGRYHQYYDRKVYYRGNNVQETYYLYGLNGNPGLEFIVPEKKGIYYFGDSIESLQPAIAKEQKDAKTAEDRKEFELRALNNAYKVYADTAWGPLFKARIEELKNEK